MYVEVPSSVNDPFVLVDRCCSWIDCYQKNWWVDDDDLIYLYRTTSILVIVPFPMMEERRGEVLLLEDNEGDGEAATATVPQRRLIGTMRWCGSRTWHNNWTVWKLELSVYVVCFWIWIWIWLDDVEYWWVRLKLLWMPIHPVEVRSTVCLGLLCMCVMRS